MRVHLKKKKETNNVTGENTNWADGWYDLKDKDIPNPDHHYTYVYTQIGETTGTEVNSKVWKFTENWPGDKMVADYTNVGWYYVDFKENAKSNEKLNENGATGVKTIKPGETLIIFSNNTYPKQGYTLHRCTHHLEPGIPLFDYEDREGWIVYDPTSDPTWNIYDAMPTIENINFTITPNSRLTDGSRTMVLPNLKITVMKENNSPFSTKIIKVGHAPS